MGLANCAPSFWLWQWAEPGLRTRSRLSLVADRRLEWSTCPLPHARCVRDEMVVGADVRAQLHLVVRRAG